MSKKKISGAARSSLGKKKHRPKPPWWTSPRAWVSLLLSGLLVAGVLGGLGFGAWQLLASGEDSGPPQYLSDPAPDFTLPTTDGGTFTMDEHRGKHNILLFINEGEG